MKKHTFSIYNRKRCHMKDGMRAFHPVADVIEHFKSPLEQCDYMYRDYIPANMQLPITFAMRSYYQFLNVN